MKLAVGILFFCGAVMYSGASFAYEYDFVTCADEHDPIMPFRAIEGQDNCKDFIQVDPALLDTETIVFDKVLFVFVDINKDRLPFEQEKSLLKDALTPLSLRANQYQVMYFGKDLSVADTLISIKWTGKPSKYGLECKLTVSIDRGSRIAEMRSRFYPKRSEECETTSLLSDNLRNSIQLLVKGL